MKWNLRDGARELELVHHRDPQLRFNDPAQATFFLRRFSQDSEAMRSLRAALQSAGAGAGAGGDDEVLRRVGELVTSGVLRLGPAEEVNRAGKEGAEGGSIWPLPPLFPVRWKEPGAKVIVKKPPQEQSKKKKPEKTWVEVKLLDDGGNPIPDAKYEVQLGDGKVKKGKLNKKGMARIEDVDPGSCVIHFPELNIELTPLE